MPFRSREEIMTTKIRGALVLDSETRDFIRRDLYFSDGVICPPQSADITLDAENMLAVPGFVDIHTHGRGGIDIMTSDKNALSKLSRLYAETGVTSVFPTVMTASLDKIKQAISNIKSAEDTGAAFRGIHVEGPYISPEKPGCHDISLIRKPEIGEMLVLTERISPLRAHFTVAPEEDKDDAIGTLSHVATVGIGHTNATAEQAHDALSRGAVSFTHTYNAMSPLTHRNTGTVGEALASDAYAEFICDGLHVSPVAVRAAYNAKLRTKDRFVLITDSIPQAGMSYGDYEMNGIPFHLGEDGAKKSDGTIVGSTLSMYAAVLNLMKFCDIPFSEAVLCATKAPAMTVKIYDKVGSLDIGKSADILICSPDYEIRSVYCRGEKIK